MCRSASVEELRAAVITVDNLESHGDIDPFPADEGPDSILPQLPEPGAITSRTEWPEIGAKELQLSNGMRVGGCADKFA